MGAAMPTYGVSACAGVQRLFLGSHNFGRHSFASANVPDPGGRVEIRTVSLDEFFAKGDDPKSVGNQLDEIMADLVYLARDEDDFGRSLTYHHYILRTLRDIFWKLEKLD